jgi:hypothetical protein
MNGPDQKGKTSTRIPDDWGAQQGLEILASQQGGTTRALQLVRDYDVPNVSEKVARIIPSCTDCVRRVVWREQA